MGKFKIFFSELSDMNEDQLNEVQKDLLNDISDKKIKFGNLLNYLNNEDAYSGLNPKIKMTDSDVDELGISNPEGYSLDYLKENCIIDLGDDWEIKNTRIDLGKGFGK